MLHAAEHRVTLISLVSLVTGSLSIIFPCLTVVVSDVPVALSYLKFRGKTVLTILSDSKNLIFIIIEHPLSVDGPIPTTILLLLHTNYRRVTLVTFLTMIDLHAATLRENDLIADLDTSFHDRSYLIDIILLLKSFNNGLKRADISIQLLAKLIKTCVDLVKFFVNIINFFTEHVRTTHSSSKQYTTNNE